ncbi:glycerol-3-phosphate 1-O-acyltransferase PlsY [Salinicoccus roseus]|jgi:glycerol-3-phosphate acyltransferase PlsY|uniref:Glycerol-3-phosphate acyltransferase n=1 Tax=Salinicoccus roseus TaxID=45670 RepID=A0A0C2HEA7_9STAP|nr:glycerol-3-phosphate 1-O-acyltransferase PlsY [Salinicoccus roseus]KIH72025.1 glycerol-3-phosphate acyltransferase [Salinicoccus roseus]MBY8908947.1 glycerol-3-phosphate 1-O-acyltransferase PlsY [Salinicoccus roseus]MDB0579177.1 glycerol-3-phosphate 1-O-acyltransferase PlsY [Salinicoccus roseus]OZT77954.1 acyl-phosphate glycerol 3-phosphate acyltransferase [Salinicoccus roseus]RPE54014.1 glycerol-3-phosphate acyltransferase PlsY [Salinicoccus roseus]
METIIILLVLSYLLGSTPFSLLIGLWFYKIDLRQHGSGNIGTTNTFRILGKKAGIVVLLLDMFKGALPVVAAMLLNVDMHIFIPGLVAAIGHVYSIFLKFRGGKAVATSAGAVLAYNPLLFIMLLAAFLITLKLSKYVSLSSIVSAVLFFILSLAFRDPLLIAFSFIIAVVIVVRHISNIKRIMDGTESKITFM